MTFSNLIPEYNKFKLHLKGSIMIKWDKPDVNRNIYIYNISSFLHNNISFYTVYLCIIRMIALSTRSCFHENLDNSSSL